MSDNYTHVFTLNFDVRWGDMDAFGHVNNSRYLTYFEQIRIEWVRSLPLKNLGEPIGPIIVTADCTYLKAIEYPAELEIKLFIGEAGNSSFMTNHEICVNGELHAHGKVKIVWFDYEKGKSVPFPEEIRALMR